MIGNKICHQRFQRHLSTGTTNLGDTCIPRGEATTMKNGIKRAIELGYKKIVIEGDSTVPIKAV